MPPTMSAEVCVCGTELEYRGTNKDVLHCTHCDEHCPVRKDQGETCSKCEAFNQQWNSKMQDIYGPGRDAA